MAQQQKTDLQALITANVQDNTTRNITAAEVREILTNFVDSFVSNYNPPQTLSHPTNAVSALLIFERIAGADNIGHGMRNSVGTRYLGIDASMALRYGSSATFSNNPAVPIILTGSVVHDPLSIAAGAWGAGVDVPVTGAALGDTVLATHSAGDRLLWLATVRAAGTAYVAPYNPTGAAINSPSGTLTAVILRASS